MGLLKFRLPTNPPSEAELRRAYVLGPDRTPTPGHVELRGGLLVIRRDLSESGRVVVPWRVEGFGVPVLATATLAERLEPFDLGVELARGTLNDVQNQLADWRQMGLIISGDLERHLAEARRHFARAATSRHRPEDAAREADAALRHALTAGRLLAESYTTQVLARRLEQAQWLSTLLAVDLPGPPKGQPWEPAVLEMANAARLRCDWASLEPESGRFRWEAFDAQLHWCRRRQLTPIAGPLIDLRAGALPDWLWLWQGDFDEVLTQAVDLVRQALARGRGKVPIWQLVHRPASNDVLGLSEEEQVRLTARLLQVARQADPDAQLVVGFDRPWGDWMAGGPFQLGPLHLADSLARADLGLSGIGLEVALGYDPWGSPVRELLEFSRLLDLFALVNLPLHISLALPAQAVTPERSDLATAPAGAWPRPPDEALQREWAERWVTLAASKPFVRSVTWLELSDAQPTLFPGAGLLRADGTPRPVAGWLKQFRREVLGRT
jgi:hypothetical protein